MFVSIGHDGFLGLVVKFFVASALLSLYSLPHSDAFFLFFFCGHLPLIISHKLRISKFVC